LGDLAAGRWRAKECRAVVSEAQRLLIDLREHPAPETRLEKLAAFVERRGLGDAFAWDRFWTNLRIERFSDAAGDARAVIELASALRDAPKLRDAAWLLIAPTTPEDKRDADLALRAARVAVELTAGEDGDQLDVLARCFVAKGQCQEAIQLFLRALEKVEPEARPEIEQALRDCGYTITR
jgi:tetratricopeptide (TPR) repeat protein